MGSFKSGRWAAALSIVAFGGVFTGACSGSRPEVTTTGTQDNPPDELLVPPAVNDGTGKPLDATSSTCASPFDCPGWYCDCSDGGVVYSKYCKNGYCLNAAGSCSDACTTPFWNHGSWTGGTAPPTAGSYGSYGVGGSDWSTSGGFGGGNGSASGGVGGGDPGPTCSDSGAPCSDSSQCCSYFCNFDTCN